MRVTYTFKGNEKVFERETTEAIIGRQTRGVPIDLVPDMKVSRKHARIFMEDGQYWVEDLNSKQGTKINGEEIKGKGKRLLYPDDNIRIGETTLIVQVPSDQTAITELLSFSATLKSLDDSDDIIDATNFSLASTKYVTGELE